MQTPETPRAPSIRARGQLRVIAAVVLGVLFTLSSAAAQLLPGRRPPPSDPIAEEVAALAEARRERIAALEALAGRTGAPCRPPEARELARLYALDGRTGDARALGAVYAQRCGEDPEVARWAAAPAPPSNR